MVNNYTFFWGGPFSQWYKSEFMLDNITYTTAEQYMMAEKALLFKDMDIYNQILKTNDPKKCKKLGQQVKNFDQKIWDNNKEQIVYMGNYAKFSQNMVLKETLLTTQDTILVEASPYDTIWGIGLAEDNIDCKNKSKWKGQNLLGFILTKVREDIKQEIENAK